LRLLPFRLIGCQLILPAFLGVGAVAEAVHPLTARVDFLQVFAGDEKKWQHRSGSGPPLIRQPRSATDARPLKSNELEIAERVLTRFGKTAGTIERRRRERPARTAPVAREASRARRRRQAPTVALRDAVLRAVEAHRGGATANDVLTYLSQEFGMTVRPNHLGMALQRHRRAGRLELRDQRWYLPRT
jgi:hypothetical protein